MVDPVLQPMLRRFLQDGRVARLATVDAGGRPAVVPICCQIEGRHLFSAIDEKPKRAHWRDLQRVRNLLHRPRAAVVVDRWDEDWRKLAWVHLRGQAQVEESGDLRQRGIALLRFKYPQYEAMALEERAMIILTITSARWWGDLTQPWR